MKKDRLYLLFIFMAFCCSLGVHAGGEAPKIWGMAGTGGNKEKAYSENWYQESASSLTISAEIDLGSLIKALKEGKTFEGKTIELNKDLDMSKYLWASTENPFKGVFNGNGYTVTGMKSGAESTPWAFIGVVDQGEVNKVIVSGTFTGDKNAGGVVGKLTNAGKVANSAYTGTLASTADGVKLGGIVGENDGGTVSNCYFTGSMALFGGTVAGAIAGTSTGTVSNSCYLPNEQGAPGVGEDTGSASQVKELSAEAFASGEASWLLNQWNSGNSGIWSTNGTLPVYASDANQAVYGIRYTDDVSQGGTATGGPEYVKAGDQVVLTPGIIPGYIFTGYLVTGAEVEINDNTFVMPQADLTVAGDYKVFEGPAINEATDITSSGFTAQWEAVDGATDYLLTVTDADGTVLESYDAYPVGNVTSYAVTNLLPVRDYNYYVQTKKDELVSKPSLAAGVKTLEGSTVTYSPRVELFKIGNDQLASQTITVSGNFVTSDITASLSGSEYFTVSTDVLPKAGGELTIDYQASVPGTHEAVLTLSTAGAVDVKIPLKGTAELGTPAPVVSAIEKHSFTATWDKVFLAGKYLLTLAQNGTVVEGYDGVETTGCTFVFKNLKMGNDYTFTVTSVMGENKLTSSPVDVTTKVDQGKQLNNSGFESWHGTGDNAEPVDWHSFMTQNDGFSMASMAKVKHMEQTAEVRPGSTGLSSTRIWTKSIVGVNANGTLTCGRINAGSMTATDYANHNYTIVGDPEFSEALAGAKPDSLTVWVKYNPIKATDQARISAIIHDTYKYQDPTDDPDILKHKVAEAVSDYSPAPDNGWQRLSLPFVYNGPSTSADYMLVTFASNKKPGGGSENDEVYIDDLLLVYKPEVKIAKVDRTSYIQGGKITVDYTIGGTMSPSNLNAGPNVVTLQLSDVNGSFDNPFVLTSVTTDYSGKLVASIPDDCPVGKGYRVRVVTTNYPMESQASADDIEIFEPGAMNISCSQIENFDLTSGASARQTIQVEGFFLTNDIKIVLDKADQGFFIDTNTLPAEGGEIVVTYSPVAVGQNSAALTLSTVGSDKTTAVNLSGVSRPVAPVIGEPSDIVPTGFTVNWEAVENATGYELTVTTAEGSPIVRTVDAVTSYAVTGLQPATEYTYSLIAKVGEIASLPVPAPASVTTLVKPLIAADRDAVDFGTLVAGFTSVTQTLYITAENLLDDIQVKLDGAHYSVYPSVLLKDWEDKIVQITYDPSEVSQSHKATLTLSTRYGENLEIPLSGASVPRATVALPAAEVTSGSFLARWDAVEGATYRLTVKKNEEVLPDYDAVPVRRGNTVSIEGLEASTKYSYFIAVVLNNQVSDDSNEVAVLTLPASGIENTTAGRGLSVYPNPVAGDLYVTGGTAVKLDVYTLDGIFAATYQVIENKANVAALTPGTYLAALTDENGRVTRVRIVKK